MPFSLYGRLYVPIPCGESRLYPCSMLFFCFFYITISVYMARDKMAAIWFDRLHQFTLLPRLSGFSLSPFQTYSSQYLPVLSKCYCKVFQWDDSKYVYINRGNTLGYILLTSCVAWSLIHLLVSQSNLTLPSDSHSSISGLHLMFKTSGLKLIWLQFHYFWLWCPALTHSKDEICSKKIHWLHLLYWDCNLESCNCKITWNVTLWL